jgi:conjugative relaxase-like TrwC/TraI family protein
MVSLSDGAMTIEDAGAYYRQHYSTVGEYYAPGEEPTIGQALGEGAAALGLQGGISAEQFEALLRGLDPASGTMLRPKPTGGGPERAGWDVTLSPPKSISIQALVAGDTRLIEADRQAAISAIQEAEACALARRRGGKEWVQTANLVAVMFEHHDARESLSGEHGPMPQLHHHTFITNLTRTADGQWRGLDPKEIYKARRFIDAVYMTELANRVQAIGYQIERRSDGAFELAGFTRQQIEAFSERRHDIQQLMVENGITDPRSQAARQFGTQGRKAKREHDPEVLKAEREALAAAHGIRLDHHPLQPVRQAVKADEQAGESLDFAIRHTTARQAVVDHRDIAAAALRHGLGRTDLAHVRAAIATHQQSRNLFAGGRSYLHPLDTYTTREMIGLERQNLALVRDHMKLGRPVAGITIRSAVDGSRSSTGAPEVREWAAARGLLADQADAAVLTLTTPQWASAIEGFAGTSKTTTVGAVREFAEGQGWTVRGFGTTSGSVNALSAAGIDSRTIARSLASPLPPRTSCELWVIDESSLLASRAMNQLLQLAQARGVERLVFVGDQRQHLAIEAGRPLRQFLEDNLAVARLTTIRRQRDPELRRAVELAAAGQIPETIELLRSQNRVVEVPQAASRYDRIAAAYLNAHEAGERCLVVAPAHDERKALNQAIRDMLVKHGHVATIGQEHSILVPRDLTPAQLQHVQSYREGDVLYIRRGSKRQGIANGAYLTVAAVNAQSLTVQADRGGQFEFRPDTLKGVQVYTSETRTIAIGDRLQWREPDNARRIANGQYATITALNPQAIEVRLDHGRQVALARADARKVDLGYASTSHAAQGATVDRVLVNIDSSRGPQLVNDRMCYVAISRARLDARIYTDDEQRMRRAVARTQEKEMALDLVDRPRPQHRPTAGFRM